MAQAPKMIPSSDTSLYHSPVDPTPMSTLSGQDTGTQTPWKSYTEYRAHSQAVSAGGFDKHHSDDIHAGVKAVNKERRAQHDGTHRNPVGAGAAAQSHDRRPR